jgi:hypothetical protein
MVIDIVVARCNENVDSWIKRVVDQAADGSGVVRFCVYNKGAPNSVTQDLSTEQKYRVTVVDSIPNIGREAHTYLYHIVERYSALAELTLFVQGDPFPHISAQRRHTAIHTLTDGKGGAIAPTTILEEKTPPMHFARVNVHAAAQKVFGWELPAYRFSPGAQYAVPRQNILARPLAWWQRLLDMVVDDSVNAWEVERLWMYIFGFETYFK